MKRLTRSVIGGSQVEMFEQARRAPGGAGKKPTIVFDDRDPYEIFIGTQRLDRYLRSSGSGWVIQVREALRDLAWDGFIEAYEKRGRPPYHPASMTGLILYGTMMGQHSLRELERLARMDVGAMWVCGGICPDHASLGRFIQLHQARLTEKFFEDVTRFVVKRLGCKATVVAGDGTVIEAAGSRFRMMKQEAARQAAAEASERAKQSPEDAVLERKAEQAAKVAAAADERVTRRQTGKTPKNPGANAVCRTDPDAPLLKTKRGVYSPGFMPSALANEERVILGQHVLPSSEAEAVGRMLEQAKRVAGPVETVLLDGNYCNGTVMDALRKQDVTVICPPKPATQKKKKEERKAFPKADFRYDSELDVYTCPAGRQMRRRGIGHKGGLTYIRYAPSSRTCKNCPLRKQCLTGTQARRDIQRFPTDEFREALQITNALSRAASLMKRRKAIVEPVFSDLRGVQKLNRFRRYGLAGARVEYALHAAAYNVRRMITLLARRTGAAEGRPFSVVAGWRTLALALALNSFSNWLSGTRKVREFSSATA